MPRSPLLVGVVIDRDPATARVRVRIEGADAIASAWMPVIFAKTGDDKVCWLPDLDEQVACLVDPHADFGVVLGSFYSALAAVPVEDPDGDKFHVRFKDGTTIEYDRATHHLAIDLVAEDATVALNATGNVVVTTNANVTIEAEADVTINVPDGQKVFLGAEEDAEELATKSFVQDVYKTHKHPTPSGLSGAPLPIPGETAWPNITERAVAR